VPANIEHVERLLGQLAPDQLEAVERLLEAMLDPLSRKLANAPLEDEQISEGEEHAVDEAREWRKQNKPIPQEEVLADFGLTMADFERMGRTPLDPNSSH